MGLDRAAKDAYLSALGSSGNPGPTANRTGLAKLEEKLFSVMERNAELQEENARLREENRQLRKENARLHDQVLRLKQQLAAGRKDSSTSSKPPSSDMVKPKKLPATGGKKWKKGGHPGTRAARAVALPARGGRSFRAPHARLLPGLGGRLVLSRCEPEVLQQVEITQTPTVVTEHQGLAYWCPQEPQGPLRPATEGEVCLELGQAIP